MWQRWNLVFYLTQQELRVSWNTPVLGIKEAVLDPAPEGSGPIAVELSERSIQDDFLDYLDVSVSGLSLGQTIRLERFLVDNDQGVINGDAILLDSRLVRDGHLPLTGQEPNYNETLDYIEEELEAVTFRDGEIETYFPIRGGLESIPGEYVYRVSSQSGAFEPKTERLTISKTTSAQQFVGQVLSGENPVPDAMVGVLQSVGAYSHLRSVAVADEEGRYSVYAPFVGEFDLVAIAPGFVGPFAVGTGRLIGEGEIVAQDLELTNGVHELSGTVVDSVSGDPIPGLPVTFLTGSLAGMPDGRLFTHTWTDSEGGFSVSVTADVWGITFKPSDVSSRSYLTAADSVVKTIDVRNGDQTNVIVALNKGNSLITGTLYSESIINDEGEPLPLEGVEVFAINYDSGLTASGVTYEDGWFNLAVTPGHWVVFPFSYDLETVEHPGSFGVPVHFTGADQSVELDIGVRQMRGILEGVVKNPDESPVGKLRMLAFNESTGSLESVIQTTNESDGYINFFLGAGDWIVFPDSDVAAQRQLLFSNLPRVSVPATWDPFSDNRRTVSIDLATPTNTIELFLRDPAGNAVPNVKMHGTMTSQSGDTYDAFGKTDNLGIARMPVLEGAWHIHLSPKELRLAGKQELPVVDVVVESSLVRIDQTAIDFVGDDPVVSEIQHEDGRLLHLVGEGEPGQRYVVKGSEDLEDWNVLGRVTAIEGAFSIFDDLSASSIGASGKAFYRVVSED